MHRDGISAVILDYTTSSPRPLHLLQVDKQVVAVNSSDINIELLQQYETTDGRALLSSHLNIRHQAVMKLLQTEPFKNMLVFCPQKVTQMFLNQKILHHIFNVFSLQGLVETSTEPRAFFEVNICVQTKQHADVST